MAEGTVLIVGGTGGIGRELAAHYVEKGRDVIITGRDPEATRRQSPPSSAAECISQCFDLAHPETIGSALADVGPVDKLVLCAIARDNNPVREYDVESAASLATMKLVGYTEVDPHPPRSVLRRERGRALRRTGQGPALSRLDHGDRGQRRGRHDDHHLRCRTGTDQVQCHPSRDCRRQPVLEGQVAGRRASPALPTGRLATMEDVVDATVFLLENRSVNGVNLYVDSGWLMM